MPTHGPLAAFLAQRHALTQWFLRQAMPFWSTQGTDWAQGGFFERFAPGGEALDEPRRTRVVARQIYVATVAQALGEGDTAQHTAARMATHGLDFLLNKLKQPDHTFAAGVQADGTLVNGRFDLYEQAFALFALAHAHAAGVGSGHALETAALATLSTLQARYKHPQQGFEESAPPSVPLKANPHMHLLEASRAWEARLTPHAAAWATLSDELAQLALDRFIDPATGALSELFDAHWQRMPGPQGDVVEPGHQFEWAWLLIRWGRDRGRADAIAAARKLIDIGETHGVCATRGVAINEINHAMATLDAQAKLWPQTERIKAWCALASLAQTPQEQTQALAGASRAMQGLQPYLHCVQHVMNGLWCEVMLAGGSFKAEPCRASSLYHIVCAIETLHQVQPFQNSLP